MKEQSWSTDDKSGWGDGPWQSEPDKMQWPDPETGFPCLIVRNRFGALCGYVGVPPAHPWHGLEYSAVVKAPSRVFERKVERHRAPIISMFCQQPEDVEQGRASLDIVLDVHGGVTYSAKCGKTICHEPEPGDETDIWWFGFDCSHSDDHAPGLPGLAFDLNPSAVYRDVEYVRHEITGLAHQLKDAESWGNGA